jgi:hypothetical protein
LIAYKLVKFSLARVSGKVPSNWLEESILQPLIHSTASKITTKMPSLRWFNNDEQLNALQDCYVDKITKLKRYSTRKLICFKGPSCICFLLIDKKSNNSEPSKLALSKTETQNKKKLINRQNIYLWLQYIQVRLRKLPKYPGIFPDKRLDVSELHA